MSCKYLVDGNCALSSQLAGIPVVVVKGVCEACAKQPIPFAKNNVTCDRAIFALRAADKPLTPVLVFYLQDKPLADLLAAPVANRPGTALRQILAKLSVERNGCGCDDYATKMDSWGTDGCIARFDEIVDHLNNQSVSAWEMIRIGLSGRFTTGQIVKEAIECSKEHT